MLEEKAGRKNDHNSPPPNKTQVFPIHSHASIQNTPEILLPKKPSYIHPRTACLGLVYELRDSKK